MRLGGLYGLFFVLMFKGNLLFSQHSSGTYDKIEYRKDRNYMGPDDWGANSPSPMVPEEDPSLSQDYDPVRIDYSEEEIKRHRTTEAGQGTGGGERAGETVEEPDDMPQFEEEEPESNSDFNPSPSALSSKIFLGILIAAAAIALIYFILKYRRKESVTSQINEIGVDENPAELTQSEFERLLSEALKYKNFRSAVRLYFLAVLKELIERELIIWKKDKTNQAYAKELKEKSFISRFNECLKAYDYVWYGHYPIDEKAYVQIEKQMSSLLSHIVGSNGE